MGKRILSTILALCLTLTLLPAEALAEEVRDPSGEASEPAFSEETYPEEIIPVEASQEEPASKEAQEDEPAPEYPANSDDADQGGAATIEHDLGGGLVLTFDPSTGTITKCTDVSADRGCCYSC